MASHSERLASRGIAVFVVGFDTRDSLREMRDRLGSPFQFLRDASRHSYELMGLHRASVLRTYLHPEVLKPYVRWAVNRRFPTLRRGQDRRQLGGDFVILRTGQLVYEHRELGPEDRPPVGEVVAAALSAG
jgi:hypothetical protein